jgi:chromosomal replication initiation ATPase DnaA
MNRIITLVADYFDVPMDTFYSHNREGNLPMQRNICWFLLWKWEWYKDREIAVPFHRERSVVNVGIKRAKEQLDIPGEWKRHIKALDLLCEELVHNTAPVYENAA